MKGYHHLAISILSTLPPLLPWISAISLLDALLLSLGLCAGSLAPDVDAQDARVFHIAVGRMKWLRGLFTGLGYVLRYLVYYPLSLLFRIILGGSYRHEHRGLLHTPLGVTLMTVLLLCYLEIASLLLRVGSIPALIPFGIAFLVGSFFHLLGDSSTPAGIAWGFPLSERRIRGGISTTRAYDLRPLLLILLLTGAAGSIVHLSSIGWARIAASAAALVLLFVAWTLFFVLAGVKR